MLPNSDENRSLHCLRFKPIHCHFLSYHGDGFEEVKSRVLAHKECFFLFFFSTLIWKKKVLMGLDELCCFDVPDLRREKLWFYFV